MVTGRSAPSTTWSPDVREIPLLHTPIAALERLSRERGWGFSTAELRRLRRHFRGIGRDPTDVEWAGLAQSWSEHCSYKSSRPFLRRSFGRFRRAARVLGTGDAGVVRYDRTEAYALRIESHNHPSAIEPYGGAATGIGGILRDVLAVGAHPIALADPLFFGPWENGAARVRPGEKNPRFLYDGVIAGIRDYGNRVGVPTVAGGIYFDPAYAANPLVNVACVGVLPADRLLPNRAARAGDLLVLVGGLTGRDGIGGVAFASRELTERSESESRGAVQLGNPIMKEPLMHACREAFERGLVQGLKDLGGGGLATAAGELVHAGGFGLRVDLDRVPLRDPGLAPWEIWISESQERMILDVRPADRDDALEVFRRHDVPATVLGEVARGGHERLYYRGGPVGDLELAFRVAPAELRRPVWARKPPAGRPVRLPPDRRTGPIIEDLLLAPENRSRESVVRLYDHEVKGRTVVKPLQGRVESPSHGDAAVLRPRSDSWTGLALAVGTHPWACALDPRRGAALAVEEVARNLYAVGARPDALTDCLNFGSPEDPGVLGDFSACVRGLAEAAAGLDLVVPSGNVSFYNESRGRAILPTPVLLGVGVVPDLRRAVTSDLKEVGDALYLIGRSGPELGGSLYSRRARLARLPVPRPDPAGLRRLGERLLRAIAEGTVRAAHDVADGGPGVTLAEMAFGGGLGFDADLSATGLEGPVAAAVAEGGSRLVVEVPGGSERQFERRLRGSPVRRLGSVTARGGHLRWGDRTVAELDLEGLYPRWRTGPTGAPAT